MEKFVYHYSYDFWTQSHECSLQNRINMRDKQHKYAEKNPGIVPVQVFNVPEDLHI